MIWYLEFFIQNNLCRMSHDREINLSKQLLDHTKQMLDLEHTFSLKLSMPNFDFSVDSKREGSSYTCYQQEKVQVSNLTMWFLLVRST